MDFAKRMLMRRYSLLMLCLGCMALWSLGCDSSNDESGTVTLTGQVIDADRNIAVADAVVRIDAANNPDIDETEDILVDTDEEGRFTATFEIDQPTDVLVTARKDGFSSDTQTIFAAVERSPITTPAFRIRRTREEDPVSGSPSNILLSGQSSQSIGVIESGSVEVATLTFQLADSAGRPVTLDNDALVRFRLGQQPGGGEFIAPEQAGTDNNGEVQVNLSSGTRAGVVQIIAEATLDDGTVIRSKPVSIAIHGGLPDEAHLSLGPVQRNFPGLLRFGLTNEIGVLVGDKYGNPVRPGTSVYFTTNAGVIEGSATTNSEGQGAATLISGQPFPNRGIVIVTAETAGENEQRISDQTLVVMSGVPFVNVTPIVARLGQTYTMTVRDPNGNPLAPGTAIGVSAEGTKVKAVGSTNVTLSDTGILDGNGDGDLLDYEDVFRGPGITDFIFRVVEDLEIDETGTPMIEAITITVSGPNGNVELVLTPEGTVIVPSQNASVELLDGQVLVRVNE